MAELVEKATASSFPTDIIGKVEIAKSFKDKGNELFKTGQFKKAIINYSKALAYTKGLPGRKNGLEGVSQMAMDQAHSSEEVISKDMESAVIELEVTIKTNICNCFIKLNNPMEALQTIRGALCLNPTAWKSIVRKAEATMLIDDFEKAVGILEEATKYAPDEIALQQIAHVKDKFVKQNKLSLAKQRKAFGKIFEKSTTNVEA